MSKIALLAAGAAGYVLGARAGRERYEQISSLSNRVWSNPKVQKATQDAQDLARQKAPVVGEKLTGAAKQAGGAAKQAGGAVASKVSGSSSESEPPEVVVTPAPVVVDPDAPTYPAPGTMT